MFFDLIDRVSNACAYFWKGYITKSWNDSYHVTVYILTNILITLECSKQRNGELKILKTKKEQHETQKIRESEGKTAIQKLLVEKSKDTYTEEGTKSLYSKGLKVLYMWKHGKAPKVGQNKPQLLAA